MVVMETSISTYISITHMTHYKSDEKENPYMKRALPSHHFDITPKNTKHFPSPIYTNTIKQFILYIALQVHTNPATGGLHCTHAAKKKCWCNS
jgi:hypothetical protein